MYVGTQNAYNDGMPKKILYIRPEDVEAWTMLKKISEQTGKSMSRMISEVVRHVVWKHYQENQEFLEWRMSKQERNNDE